MCRSCHSLHFPAFGRPGFESRCYRARLPPESWKHTSIVVQIITGILDFFTVTGICESGRVKVHPFLMCSTLACRWKFLSSTETLKVSLLSVTGASSWYSTSPVQICTVRHDAVFSFSYIKKYIFRCKSAQYTTTLYDRYKSINTVITPVFLSTRNKYTNIYLYK